MAITATQSPNIPFNMAYGPNPVTLSGLAVNQDKYVLQIFKLGDSVPVADVRQTPNRVGKAIFDIQNTLQALVGPSNGNLDGLHYPPVIGDYMRIADGELQQYQIKVGAETAGVVEGLVTLPDSYTVLGGKQPYWMVNFESDLYVPKISGSDGVTVCSEVERFAQPLSDNGWTISKNDTGDELLSDFTDDFAPLVDVHNVYRDDQCTKSFYNLVERSTAQAPDIHVKGIEGYWLVEYINDANTNIYWLPNVQSTGGGPNNSQADGNIPTGNFLLNTIATGPANLPVVLDPATTHYYIFPSVFDPCSTGPQYAEEALEGAVWRAQRYNIIEESCNDYPHVQFSWMNSKGMRDQFTFTEKNERSVKIKRNEFLQETNNYNGDSYDVDVHNRGYTTYSQTLKESYSVTSGFMNDDQAKLLESLYTSADVMVRFSEGDLANEWQPVRLTSMSYAEKSNRKDRLFQYTLQFQLANNIKSQRG